MCNTYLSELGARKAVFIKIILSDACNKPTFVYVLT